MLKPQARRRTIRSPGKKQFRATRLNTFFLSRQKNRPIGSPQVAVECGTPAGHGPRQAGPDRGGEGERPAVTALGREARDPWPIIVGERDRIRAPPLLELGERPLLRGGAPQ